MAAFSYSPHHDVFALDVADFPADSYFSSFVSSPSLASESHGVIPGETSAGRGEIKLEKKRRDGLQCNSSSSQLKKIKNAKPKKCSEEREIKGPKTGFIHVRARRGQATDSHSLAERARREKIRERMKMLQGLVPGCDKVIGKALLLEEIINYVQSLQNQVEFLSMKLASLNELDLESGGLILSPEKLDEMSLRQTGLHQAIVYADTADSRPIEDSSVSFLMDQGNGDGFAVQVDDNGESLFNQVGFSRLPSYFC